MTNDNNDKLIGQDDKNNIELDWGGDEDERPFPDSDEAIRALQDDAEDAEIEIARLRAELVTALAERDAARREVCLEASTDASGCYISGRHILVAENRGWDCFKQEPLPLKRKTKKEYDPRVISLEELERTTRNLRMND